jgi:hypothetical protein
MSVNHGRADVLVAEQLLDALNVVPSVKQTRCERVPGRVIGRMPGHAGLAHPCLDCFPFAGARKSGLHGARPCRSGENGCALLQG